MEQATTLAASAGDSLVAVILFNVVTSGSMAKIWGMINSMQVTSHLPIIQVELPSYSAPTIGEILEIASFEVMPIGDLMFGEEFYGISLEIVEIPHDDFEFPHSKAKDIEMESYYFIVNMGTLLFAFIASLMVPLILFIFLRPCVSKSPNIAKRHQKLAAALRGNILIRYILEACLDIGLCFALQIWYSDVNGGLNFGSTFNTLNTIFAVVLGAAAILFLPITIIFYVRNF